MNPINVLINIALPVVVLLTLSSPDRLGAVPALLIAIGIPAVWGLVGLSRTRQVDISAILGIISVLLTGVIGVFELDTRMFAVKEAAIPLTFAALLVASNHTKYPIVTALADVVQRRDRVRGLLEEHGGYVAYREHIVKSGKRWAAIMTLSGTLKFMLASFVVRAPAGTEAFNIDLAKYELVQLPTTFSLSGVLILSLIWYIASGTAKIVGESPAEVLRGGARVARITRRFEPIARMMGATPSA